MAGPGAVLREIHRLRSHASALQERIDGGPRQLRAQQNVVAKREEELKEAQDGLKKLKVGILESESSVKSAHGQIKRYEQQLNDITSKKEYDALQHEIAAVREKIKATEEEALTAMMEVDEKTTLIPEREAALKKAKAEFAEFERDYQSRLDDWTKQRDAAAAEYAAKEKELPSDVRQHYDRLVKSMGADAFAAVENRICAACYTELTAQVAHNVQQQQFVMCRSCARILYPKE
jgi:predicted  nucleic acid-binding Zn-ribbon protein